MSITNIRSSTPVIQHHIIQDTVGFHGLKDGNDLVFSEPSITPNTIHTEIQSVARSIRVDGSRFCCGCEFTKKIIFL